MKKKFFYALSVICLIVCTLLLTACNTNQNPSVIPVREVTLSETEITLTEGDWETLTATISPSNATDNYLEWTTSNPSVVTVDEGRLYAVGEGKAVVTARSNNGKSAACTVTVEAEIVAPTQYTVIFHAEGGTFEDGKNTYVVEINEGAKLPAVTVTRGEEYVFTAWYRDEYRTRLWDVAEDVVNDDTNLYAGWKYLNPYQSVIDALANRIKAERQTNNLEVEILSIFTDSENRLCFVEKDSSGVFSYQTDIYGVDEVKGNTALIAQIPDAALLKLKDYNDIYTSDNNYFRAGYMAWKYTDAESADTVIYSCVSDWEDDGRDHYLTNPPWYRCNVRAIFADDDGHVFDCSFVVVSGVRHFDYVINGTALSQEFDLVVTELGEIADDFYLEREKEQNA